MIELNRIEIPESLKAFANELMAACDKAGLDRASVEIRPDFHRHPQTVAFGTIRVIYVRTDGRGRPARDLSIQIESTQKLWIICDPKSS